jgi:hypothetical protein
MLPLATETVPTDEEEFARRLRELLRAKMAREYPDTLTQRDAHPKHHGCVRAAFVVGHDVPKDLAVGLFARPATYDAWVRFSNQHGTAQADAVGDIRGAAIKILGVPGPKLLPGCEDATAHDLVLITTTRFVTRDVKQFHDLIAAMVAGRWRLLAFLARHFRVGWNLWRSLERFANLLEITYTSPTPYLLGAKAVRYRLEPRRSRQAAMPTEPSDNFLRQRLGEDLASGPAEFAFMVQVQTDPARMPIEDPGVAWPERLSPYRAVATLRILRQDVESHDQMALAEHISFNPWRCLAEHRPLGGINRARKTIYAGLSDFRHGRNDKATDDAGMPI